MDVDLKRPVAPVDLTDRLGDAVASRGHQAPDRTQRSLRLGDGLGDLLMIGDVDHRPEDVRAGTETLVRAPDPISVEVAIATGRPAATSAVRSPGRCPRHRL